MRMKKIKFLLVTLVALLAGVSSVAAKTVYIQPNDWTNDGAVISLNVWVDGSGGNTWATLTEVETGILKATFDDSFDKMAILRANSGYGNKWKSEDDTNVWNQSADIDIVDGKLYSINSGSWNNAAVGSGITVSDYTEPAAAGYTFNFNNTISTSNRDFAVASNWGHIVDYDSYYDNHMSYSYSATTGVDGSGALLGYGQLDYDWGQQSSGRTTYDLIVTPLVSGEVTLAVKLYNTTGSVKFYKVSEVGGVLTRGDEIDPTYSDTPSQSAYVTATINVDVESRIGIRVNYAYIDNFTAENATIIPEKAITISSAAPTATTGTIYWNQQANGKVLVKYTVTVTNTGDVALTQGTDGYSVSIFNRTTNDVYCTVPVPQDLAVGATSDPFDVEAELETSVWPNTYTYYSMDLRENLKSTVVQRAQSGYKAYQSTFVFRADGSTSTSSISSAESWGTITASTTKSFEIYNGGLAPLTINSITLPDGFTSADVPVIPAAGLEIAGNDKVTFSITQDATATGTFAGTLTIAYQNYGSATATNYTLDFSATVIGANTWTHDFNTTKSGIVYPAGSIAEAGINSDYDYNSGVYNYWITGRTQTSYATGNNMFITPKLHAAAGDKLAYDVKGAYGSSYYAKVYVSTDRKNWNQVAYYTQNAAEGAEAIGYSNWYTKTVTFNTEGDYYVAFSLYGTFKIDNLVGLEKVDVAHDIYIKSVNWPDASIKSGASQTKPSVDIIPLTDEDAANYTVKYMYGETVLAVGTPVAMTASASSSKTFSFSWAPSVENTKTYNGTKVVFEFTDGTKFETETFDLTVTNEPIFHFLNSIPSSKWNEPTDYTTPISFGKTNTADTQTFYLYNWGSAPLTVNSVTLPEGFSTTATFPMTIAAMDESNLSASAQALDITFSAATAGNYSGDMVITHSGNQTFTLAISGMKLDPTKWYANFDDGGWPSGSVYQSNISSSNGGTASVPNYYITSSSTTNNIFVTPKLTAVSGDKIAFDAKLYSSYWSEGAIKVYAATTRDEVLNAEAGTTRTQLFYASGEDTSADATITTDYQTFEVSVPAGEWYLGFEISNRPYIDEIYGLAVASVAHDLKIASSNIPTEGMQNNSFATSVNVLNLGLNDDAGTVTAYVDGEAVATSAAVTVPMNHKLTDAGTQASVNFICPKAGTFPVYLEVKAGDFTVATDPVNVTFAEEVAKTDVATGESAGTDGSIPLNMYYKNSETIALYTQSALGLNGGEKIKSITWKGYSTKTFTSAFKVYYEWTDDTSISKPTSSSAYDVTGMTAAIDAPEYSWSIVGSSTELGDMIVINFAEPLNYVAGKSLRILVSSSASNDAGNNSFKFEKSTITGLAYQHQNDGTKGVFTGSWNAKELPMIHIGLESSAASLAGTVKTSAGVGIEGATVTLKAGNGVQYSGTTAADGSYSINVIQAGLDFTATVEATGYLKKQFAYNLGGASKTLDVTMYHQMGIVGDPGMGLDWNTDAIMTQDVENPNIFTLEKVVTVTTPGTYYYKLRADGAWDNNLAGVGYELPSSGNENYTFNVAGNYTLKFTADVADHKLTLELPYVLAEDNAADIVAQGWANIKIERNFKEGWNAVVLPFDIPLDNVKTVFGDGTEVAVYVGDEGSGNVTVKFIKTTEGIKAGVPCLLWLEDDKEGFSYDAEVKAGLTTVPGTSFDFVGVYKQTTNENGDYIVQGGEFRKASTSNFVRPFRSYLKLKDGVTVRSINLFVGDEDVTTEIDGLNIETPVNVDGIYNLNGQKVQNMKKGGLYIINGKKVVLK